VFFFSIQPTSVQPKVSRHSAPSLNHVPSEAVVCWQRAALGVSQLRTAETGLIIKVAKPVTQLFSGDKEMSRCVMERFMSRARQQADFKFVT